MDHPQSPAWTPTETDELLQARQGAVARIALNRPGALNALNRPMVRAMGVLLREWADDDTVQTVTIEGRGERGLCAGGDVIAVREVVLEGGGDRVAFFREEYRMNDLLATYRKPVVAFMDGVTMGGGIGISGFARHRLVTERSKVAMPETIIGFFPDVGALHLLSRAPGELGTHLALTGATVDGPGAIAAGLADRLVAAGEWEPLVARLADGEALDERAGEDAPRSDLAEQRSWIDECYAGDDPAQVVARLEGHDDPKAREAGELLRARSPLAVAVTLEALRRAATMETVREVLEQDLVLATRLSGGPDFTEGVRAQLVDKDKTPTWQHARIEDVTRDEVEAVFTP